MVEKLEITLIESPISAIPEWKATVKTLRLTRMHKAVEVPDNGTVRGMVAAVRHLVEVEEV